MPTRSWRRSFRSSWVGLVTVGGTKSVDPDPAHPAQLAAMNLDFETVRLALANLIVVQPTGLLYGGQQAGRASDE